MHLFPFICLYNRHQDRSCSDFIYFCDDVFQLQLTACVWTHSVPLLNGWLNCKNDCNYVNISIICDLFGIPAGIYLHILVQSVISPRKCKIWKHTYLSVPSSLFLCTCTHVHVPMYLYLLICIYQPNYQVHVYTRNVPNTCQMYNVVKIISELPNNNYGIQRHCYIMYLLDISYNLIINENYGYH